jgi:hypothetical protein
VNQVIDDELMPPVGAPLEVARENRVRLEQCIDGCRQGVDVDGPFRCAPRPTKLCVSANISSLRASFRITIEANISTSPAVGGYDD